MPERHHSREYEQAANDAINLRAGQAMARWGFVESGLTTWFERLTKMHPLTSRRVFYSVTGFDPRRRMLLAAIKTVTTQPDISEYLIAIVNKAGDYANTRNRIVHGDTLFIDYSGSRYFGQCIILEGRQHWVADPPAEQVLTCENLEIARDNFGTLASYIVAGLNWEGTLARSPLRFLEPIRALPNPAHSSRLDPSIAARVPLDEADVRAYWR